MEGGEGSILPQIYIFTFKNLRNLFFIIYFEQSLISGTCETVRNAHIFPYLGFSKFWLTMGPF